jgi:hypothetical protein
MLTLSFFLKLNGASCSALQAFWIFRNRKVQMGSDRRMDPVDQRQDLWRARAGLRLLDYRFKRSCYFLRAIWRNWPANFS